MGEDAPAPAALPRCICIPSEDLGFAEHVSRVLVTRLYQTPAELQERLRRVYPTAVVRKRDLSGEMWPTWYVYRDSHVSRRDGGAWWERPDAARVAFRGHRIIDANAGMHALLSHPPGSLIGCPLADILPAGLDEDVEILLRMVREGRTITSTFVVVDSAHKRLDVEHRTRVREDGAVESVVREIAIATRDH
jgi:PAS domain-containing protein